MVSNQCLLSLSNQLFIPPNTITAQIPTTLIQTVDNVNKIYLVSQGLENNDKQMAQ